MNQTRTLRDLGQSLWLDTITRDLVNSGTLRRRKEEFSVTGLISNPTIFDHGVKSSADYDSDISHSASRTKPPEDLFLAGLGRSGAGRRSVSVDALAAQLLAAQLLAAQLQDEGSASFVKSWNDLTACVESNSAAMRKAS